MEVLDLLETSPSINITINAGQLREIVDYAISQTKAELEKKPQAEQYRTPKEAAEEIGCNLSTLWRWNRKNYLKPIEIGGRRRYRQSDIDKILKKED